MKFRIPPVGLVPAVKDAQGFIPLTNPTEKNTDSDINFQGVTDQFAVVSGAKILNIGAGFYPMATTGNLVWEDTNANGIQENNEPRVEGVKVEVYDSTYTMVREAYTNANGVYYVDYLGRGQYYMKFTPPAGYGFTIPNNGGELVDNDVDHSNGLYTTSWYAVEPGENYVNIDAGVAFGVLPVTWLDVNANYNGKTIDVSWATATEVNTASFEVERMTKNGDFDLIGEVKAAGNSATIQRYAFEDIDMEEGATFYYRIKQIDQDGKYSYSDIVSAAVPSSTNDDGIKLYPIPAIDKVTLKFTLRAESSVKVHVIDSKGSRVIDNLINSNYQEGVNKIELGLNSLTPGIYTALVVIDGVEYNRQLIIIE